MSWSLLSEPKNERLSVSMQTMLGTSWPACRLMSAIRSVASASGREGDKALEPSLLASIVFDQFRAHDADARGQERHARSVAAILARTTRAHAVKPNPNCTTAAAY
jgi:hypothetical protein